MVDIKAAVSQLNEALKNKGISLEFVVKTTIASVVAHRIAERFDLNFNQLIIDYPLSTALGISLTEISLASATQDRPLSKEQVFDRVVSPFAMVFGLQVLSWIPNGPLKPTLPWFLKEKEKYAFSAYVLLTNREYVYKGELISEDVEDDSDNIPGLVFGD